MSDCIRAYQAKDKRWLAWGHRPENQIGRACSSRVHYQQCFRPLGEAQVADAFLFQTSFLPWKCGRLGSFYNFDLELCFIRQSPVLLSGLGGFLLAALDRAPSAGLDRLKVDHIVRISAMGMLILHVSLSLALSCIWVVQPIPSVSAPLRYVEVWRPDDVAWKSFTVGGCQVMPAKEACLFPISKSFFPNRTAGYLASGTSFAPWFHVGAIFDVLKAKFPDYFWQKQLPQTTQRSLTYRWWSKVILSKVWILRAKIQLLTQVHIYTWFPKAWITFLESWLDWETMGNSDESCCCT